MLGGTVRWNVGKGPGGGEARSSCADWRFWRPRQSSCLVQGVLALLDITLVTLSADKGVGTCP